MSWRELPGTLPTSEGRREMPEELEVSEELERAMARLGLGHREASAKKYTAFATGRREIYRMEGGDLLGIFTEEDAWELIRLMERAQAEAQAP